MSAIQTDSGHVLAVTVSNVGSSLDGDHAAGATVLTLVDCADFDDTFGGQLVIDGVTYTYSAVDDDASTVAISPALSASQDDQTEVALLDNVTQQISTESVASVTLDGFDPGDVMQVHVLASLADRLPGGVRGIIGESVTLQRDEHGTWELVDVIGKSTSGSGRTTAFRNTDAFTAESPGETTITLTFLPIDGSEHVLWNGLSQPPTEWTRAGQVVTFTDTENLLRGGDVISVAYAYDPATPVAAHITGGVLLDFEASSWKWLQIGLSDATDYSATAFDDSAWATASAAFGDGGDMAQTGLPAHTTHWAMTTRMWARRTLTGITPGVAITGTIRSDEDSVIYLDGVSVWTGAPNGYEMAVSIDASLVTSSSMKLAVRTTDDVFSLGCYFDLKLEQA